MKKRSKLVSVAGLGVVVGLGIASVITYVRHTLRGAAPSQTASPQAPVAETRPAPGPSARAPEAPPASSRTVPPAREKLAELRTRFGGDQAQLALTPDGFLASLRAPLDGTRRAAPGYRSEDARKAIARARDIVDAMAPALGVSAELPLEAPVVRADATTAQVVFREQSGGIPLAPGGIVTVDLGPQGELIGLYSEYARDVPVSGSARLSADEGRAHAVAAVPEQGSAQKPEGGSRVIWVRTVAGQSEGRHAYEYLVQGRQVIVDSENGEILFKRDRRTY